MPDRHRRPGPAPTALRIILAASAYFVAGKLGLRFAFLNASASAIWPATGLALAMLLLWGFRFWPVILLGAFLVNITTAGSWLNALLIAAGNTLEAVTGAWLASRFADGRHAFRQARHVVSCWFLACMVSTALAATIGVTSLCATGASRWSHFTPLWFTWWLGDAVGGFLGAALILLWSERPRVRWTRHRIVETAVIYTFVAGITILVFNGWFISRLFYIVPALMWAAFRLGSRDTAGALALLAIISIWGTLKGTGPFITSSHSHNQALLALQSYLAVLAITNLTVASVVEERRRALAALRLAHDEMEQRVHERTALLSTANDALRVEIGERRAAEGRFRRLLESAPDAMVIVGANGTIEIVNSQTETMFGYTRDELIGRPVDMLVPERQRAQHRFQRMHPGRERPAPPGADLVGLRRDGSEFPLEITLSPITMERETVVCAAIRDKTEQKALEARVVEAERERGDQMRALAVFVQGAQEEERRRVARELHDDLGQRLSALKLSMHVFEHDLRGGVLPGLGRLDGLVGDVDRMITEVRRISYNLRPLALDDFGLSVALEMLCKEFERVYNVSTYLRVNGPAGVPHDGQIDIALYRVAQGALSNVAKHAGAGTATVCMTRGDDSVVLSVEDDGRGFDTASLRKRRDGHSGLGVIGMRERSEVLGGTFSITSAPDHGTRVQVQIPVSNANAGQKDSNTHSG